MPKGGARVGVRRKIKPIGAHVLAGSYRKDRAQGTTSYATFAAPLAQSGIAADVLTLLRGASIIGALEGRMRRVLFRTNVARETGSASGGACRRPQAADNVTVFVRNWPSRNAATPAMTGSSYSRSTTGISALSLDTRNGSRT